MRPQRGFSSAARLVCAAFVFAALPACTAITKPSGLSGGTPIPSLSESPTGSANGDPTPEGSASPGTSDSTRPGGKTAPDGNQAASTPYFENPIPLSVEVNKTCLDRGQQLAVTATTEPRAGVGMAVGYTAPPEGQDKIVPDYTYIDHEGNPTGEVRWAFVIRPNVPYGPAILRVLANGESGRGAHQDVRFKVSNSCA